MSKYVFQKSILATVGVAIASTGLLFSVSGRAQDATPGTIKASPSPVMMPSKKPGDGMSKPADGGSPRPATAAPVKKKMTIVDIAVGSRKYKFKTLVAALKAADLVETLSGEGPYTVFAPTDEAFAALPPGALKKLLKPENKEQLKSILTYHVVAGSITSKMLKSGNVDTVEGSPVMIKVKGSKVKIKNARVIKADIKASNGIIHVIDRVIMPPAPTTTPSK